MLGQNAQKTTDHRQARRVPPGSRRTGLTGIRSESAPRRSDRDWGDGQDDEDDPDSVLGVQVSIVDAMRSMMASGGRGPVEGHDAPEEPDKEALRNIESPGLANPTRGGLCNDEAAVSGGARGRRV